MLEGGEEVGVEGGGGGEMGGEELGDEVRLASAENNLSRGGGWARLARRATVGLVV